MQKRFLFLNIETEAGDLAVSSIQAFESSLLMAMHGRWVVAIVSAVNAIETCLKQKFGTTFLLWELIEAAADEQLFSVQLAEQVDNLRKQRNRFSHSKISPRDNPKAAYDYLTKIIPTLRVLYREILGFELYEVFECRDLPDIFKKYRRVLTKSSAKIELDSNYFKATVIEKALANLMLYDVSPCWVMDQLDELETYDPFGSDFVPENFKYLYEGHDYSLFAEYLRIPCPASPCKGILVVYPKMEFEEATPDPYTYVEVAKCPVCDLNVDDPVQLKAFITPLLDPSWIESEHEARLYETNPIRLDAHLVGALYFRFSIPSFQDYFTERYGVERYEGIMNSLQKLLEFYKNVKNKSWIV